jgi:Na+/H+ antiporter NhaA
MTQNQIASLSLKLLGIYSILEAIPILRELSQVFAWRGLRIEMESGPPDTDLLLIGILMSVGLLLLIGFCLIIFSQALAKQMVSEGETKDSLTELSAKNIQSIAFSIVGLVMIVIAIPHLVQLAANLQGLKKAGDEMRKQSISIGTWAYSIGTAVQFVVGILLFLGGRGLSSLWFFFQRLRPMKNL